MGLRSRTGYRLTLSQIHKNLQNPFYIGVNRFNGADYPGAQTPIIRKEVFDAVQEKVHSGRPQKFVRHNVSLSGVVTCAQCGKQIVWQLQKGRYYGACTARKDGCKGLKYVREDTVQKAIIDELNRLFCPSQKLMQWVLETMRTSLNKDVDNREEVMASTRSRITRLKSMDDTLYDDKLSGEISKEKYLQKHAQILQEIETMERAMETFDDDQAESKRHGIYLTELSQRAGMYYQDKDEDEKRQVILELFKGIVIDNGEATVTMKRFLVGIAEASDKSREVIRTLKSQSRTDKNTPDNGGADAVEKTLRPIWQGLQDDYRTYCGITSFPEGVQQQS